jgi:hypothetical protein
MTVHLGSLIAFAPLLIPIDALVTGFFIYFCAKMTGKI